MRFNIRIIKLSIIIITFLTIITITPVIGNALKPRSPYTPSYYTEFKSAEYLDADLDWYQNDTRFFVYIYFNPMVFEGRYIWLYCYFEIITPSGIIYAYSGYIIIRSVNSILQVDAYETVHEFGWYIINFYSTFQYRYYIYESFCSIAFDPPTGHGEGGGTPTIEF